MAQSYSADNLRDDPPAPRAAGWTRSAVRDVGERMVRPAVEALRRFKGPVRPTADGNAGNGPDEALQALCEEVLKAQAGDSLALANLIEQNRAWVRGIAYAVLGDNHLAEDAAQDVSVRMVKHLSGLDTPDAFRPWLYRMTRNVALSMAHRRERSPQPLGYDAEPIDEGGRAVRTEAPGAALEEGEQVSSILETINKLPDLYREVLILKHVQDLSYAEMSTILGVNVKALEVRLVRARKMLQERLGRSFTRGRKRDPRNDAEDEKE